MGLGPAELIFVFLIVLLLFGARRLPEIGSSLGKGIREFKSSFQEVERELKAPSEGQIAGASATGEETASGDDDSEPSTLKDGVTAGQEQ